MPSGKHQPRDAPPTKITVLDGHTHPANALPRSLGARLGRVRARRAHVEVQAGPSLGRSTGSPPMIAQTPSARVGSPKLEGARAGVNTVDCTHRAAAGVHRTKPPAPQKASTAALPATLPSVGPSGWCTSERVVVEGGGGTGGGACVIDPGRELWRVCNRQVVTL